MTDHLVPLGDAGCRCGAGSGCAAPGSPPPTSRPSAARRRPGAGARDRAGGGASIATATQRSPRANAALADGLDRARVPAVRDQLRPERRRRARRGLPRSTRRSSSCAAPSPSSRAAAIPPTRFVRVERGGSTSGSSGSRDDPRFSRGADLAEPQRPAHRVSTACSRNHPARRNAKTRERQRMIAKYVQRYAAKNDSIGFFGPVGWGIVDPAEPGLCATPGPALVDHRVVSFEDWRSRRSPRSCRRTPRSAPCSRRAAPWSCSTATRCTRHRARRARSPAWRPGWSRASTATRVGDLALAATADPASGVASAEQAVRELERLGRENVITWGIEVPAELDRPERWLLDRLVRIADPVARARALEPVERLEATRVHVAEAAGARTRSTRARRRSSASSKPPPGCRQAWARTGLRRQADVLRGLPARDRRAGRRAVIDPLAGPLTPILHSAGGTRSRSPVGSAPRSMTPTIARWPGRPRARCRCPACSRRSAHCSHPSSAPPADRDPRPGRAPAPLGRDRRARARRPRQRVGVVPLDTCRARIAELFRAPCPGWPRARYHSPDVMLAAASVDANRAGRVHRGARRGPSRASTRCSRTWRIASIPSEAALDEAYHATWR